MPKHVTMTAQEAEALFNAAEYYRKQHWGMGLEELTTLNVVVSKLRRADVITIEQEE
jgi:hypothetical protein